MFKWKVRNNLDRQIERIPMWTQLENIVSSFLGIVTSGKIALV